MIHRRGRHSPTFSLYFNGRVKWTFILSAVQYVINFLSLPVKDRDWVVVGATPEMLLAQGYQQVGKDFPVFLNPESHEEYALARTERKSGKGYTGFICDFSNDITLEQDLIRRDLTINAIAKDKEGKLYDPYHGVEDIHQRIFTSYFACFC